MISSAYGSDLGNGIARYRLRLTCPRVSGILVSVDQTPPMTADNIAAVFALSTAAERQIHSTWYESARVAAIAIADATGLEL